MFQIDCERVSYETGDAKFDERTQITGVITHDAQECAYACYRHPECKMAAAQFTNEGLSYSANDTRIIQLHVGNTVCVLYRSAFDVCLNDSARVEDYNNASYVVRIQCIQCGKTNYPSTNTHSPSRIKPYGISSDNNTCTGHNSERCNNSPYTVTNNSIINH
jgi:hypothetical protein